jgi:hypothetical protein
MIYNCWRGINMTKKSLVRGIKRKRDRQRTSVFGQHMGTEVVHEGHSYWFIIISYTSISHILIFLRSFGWIWWRKIASAAGGKGLIRHLIGSKKAERRNVKMSSWNYIDFLSFCIAYWTFIYPNRFRSAVQKRSDRTNKEIDVEELLNGLSLLVAKRK